MNKAVYLRLLMLELNIILMYNLWYNQNQNMVKKQNCVIWVHVI